MRICILTQADTLAWTQHYVEAFRKRADVITVGPGLTSADIENWGIDQLADSLVPNDIDVPLTNDLDLRTVLPSGWEPDLLVGISKGGVALRTLPDTVICPSVYLSIDTWQSPGDYVDAQCYDFTFAAQRSFVDRLRASGASNVYWLPLACNPAAHYPVDIEADLDFAFVGNIILPVHQRRHELLLRLQDSCTSIAVTRAFGDESCQVMARGKLAFNHCAVDDVNMRIFEAMGMGRPLLTNRSAERNGLFELFDEGKHLIVYDGEDDVAEKALYYLDHDDERHAIAHAGREAVLSKHTYLHRVDTVLETVMGYVPVLHEQHAQLRGRIDHAFANLVPFGSARIVDAGLSLRGQAAALHARGTKEIVGISNGDNASSSEPGYDGMYSIDDPASWPRNVDTVVLSSTELLGGSTTSAIRITRNLLEPGGTLIIRLTARDFSTDSGISSFNQLENAMTKFGMHLNLGKVDESDGTSVIVRARKRTRLLRRLVDEGFAHFPEIERPVLTEWVAALGEHY